MEVPGFLMTLEMWLVLIWMTYIDVASGGEYCFHYRDGVKYCRAGCCGRALQEYCCLLATWTVVLLVLGGLLVVSVLAFVCLFYYCKKRGRTSGRVVYPQPAAPVTTVHTVYPGYPSYPGATPVQPPPYTPGTFYQGGSYPPPGQQPPPTGQQPPPPHKPPDQRGTSNANSASDAGNPYGPGLYEAGQSSARNQPAVNPTRRLDPAYPPQHLY